MEGEGEEEEEAREGHVSAGPSSHVRLQRVQCEARLSCGGKENTREGRLARTDAMRLIQETWFRSTLVPVELR